MNEFFYAFSGSVVAVLFCEYISFKRKSSFSEKTHKSIEKIKENLSKHNTQKRKHEHLKDFSTEELKSILEKNESTECSELACYCSEILRRILKGDIKLDKEKNDDSTPTLS